MPPAAKVFGNESFKQLRIPRYCMARMTAWILAFTKGIGGVGIFVIAFLDSSFLSFPGVTDATIVSMVVANRERVLFCAGLASLGSVAGCPSDRLHAQTGQKS